MRCAPPSVAVAALLLLLAAVGAPAAAQIEDRQDLGADPIPPPLPKPKPPEQAEEIRSIVPEVVDDVPWVLPDDLLENVQNKAEIYRDYAKQFICDETVRLADYNASGEVSDEKRREYAYVLTRNATGESVREYRQLVAKDGKLRGADDEELDPFPPAYAWVFMFSRFHEPYFSLRHIDKRFDGFDLVHEIQFRGSLPFTDGRDIRQWEGTVLVDAFTFTPIEIRAEPTGQRERIVALYRAWAQSFNILGFRTKKPPLGYRATLQFRHRRDNLSFPTELRYDTYKAVSPTQIVPIRASTRTYRNYRFTETSTTVTPGDPVEP